MYIQQDQNMMMQMQTANGALGFQGMNQALGMVGSNGKFFYFEGNSLSLQARLESLTDEDINGIVDAQITVTGVQIQSVNNWSLYCTFIWGSIILLPLFLMCMDWWKRCTFAACSISQNVYISLGKLIHAPNIRNITLNVNDNTLDAKKANILYAELSQSRLNGFTFVNYAGAYDFNSNEYSSFIQNMRPIKSIPRITSDIRWGTDIVF